MTPRENLLELLKPDGRPDRLLKQYEPFKMAMGNPVNAFVRGVRSPGMAPLRDRWGTTIIWPEDSPGAIPHITAENKPVPDVTRWRDFVKVPDLIAGCSADEVWEPYLEAQSAIDRERYLVTAMAPTGVFERMHFLMGFEDTLVNLMLEPEAMHELAEAIGEYRLKGFKLLVEHSHPDVILSHDDWGTKTSLFMQPEVWREFIKPQYVKIYDYLHDSGVIILHHSDSFCEPIVEDMVDLHIDIWQGVLPQNDIAAIQRRLDGRMALMGGIDAGIVDRSDSTEEEIRAEVRRACLEYAPGGHFIPCITYGAPGTINPEADIIINDEIERCSRELFGK